MKRQKRRTLSTAVMAAVLSLGFTGTAWAAYMKPSQEPAPNFPQIIEKMMEDAHFMGPRHRGRRGMRGPLPLLGAPAGFHLAAVSRRTQAHRRSSETPQGHQGRVFQKGGERTRRNEVPQYRPQACARYREGRPHRRGEENTRGFEHAGGFENCAPQGDPGGEIRLERRAAEAAIENRPEAPGPRPQVP